MEKVSGLVKRCLYQPYLYDPSRHSKVQVCYLDFIVAMERKLVPVLLLGLVIAFLSSSVVAAEMSISGSLLRACPQGTFSTSCAADGNACFESQNVTCCGCRAKNCWGCESLGCPLVPFGNCTTATMQAPNNNLKSTYTIDNLLWTP